MTVSTVIALSLHLGWVWPQFNFAFFPLLNLLGILLFHCQSLVLSKDVDWLKCFLWNNFISVSSKSRFLLNSLCICSRLLRSPLCFFPSRDLENPACSGTLTASEPDFIMLRCWKPWDRLQESTALGQTQHPQLERCVPTSSGSGRRHRDSQLLSGTRLIFLGKDKQ